MGVAGARDGDCRGRTIRIPRRFKNIPNEMRDPYCPEAACVRYGSLATLGTEPKAITSAYQSAIAASTPKSSLYWLRLRPRESCLFSDKGLKGWCGRARPQGRA